MEKFTLHHLFFSGSGLQARVAHHQSAFVDLDFASVFVGFLIRSLSGALADCAVDGSLPRLGV